MRVFLSGGTGVLGRRVIKLLVDGGYQVVGLSRSQANTDWLIQHGAEPRQGDLFNQEEINHLTSDCEAVLHLATAIPTKLRTKSADWSMNDRIRREGTRVMLGAALHNHCDLFLQQSIISIYGEHGGKWVDESIPVATHPSSILQSAVDMEQMIQDAITDHKAPAVILRFGSFYSHDSAQTSAMFQMTKKGTFPILGNGRFYWNLISADDAARAVFHAVENHSKIVGQTINVCDDLPILNRDLLTYMADILEVRKPFRIPLLLAKLLLGSDIIKAISASFRCRNNLAKENLNWQPQFQTYREGFRVEIEKWQGV